MLQSMENTIDIVAVFPHKTMNGVDRMAGRLFCEMLDIWKGSSILHHNSIKRLKVVNNSNRTVFLGNAKPARLVRAIGGFVYTRGDLRFNKLNNFVTDARWNW